MTQEIMDKPRGLPGLQQDGHHDSHLNSHLRPKHAHSLIHRNLKRKREMADKRQEYVQTALDVVVVSDGATVGDVLLGSIPSDPTTASLPGFGLLTLSGFVPAATTDGASSSAVTTPAATSAATSTANTGSSGTSQSSPAPTAAASASSLTPAMTGSNSTVAPLSGTNSTASSVAFNFGMATSLNASISTTPTFSSTFLSSTEPLTSSSTLSTSFSTTTSSFASSSSPTSTEAGGAIGGGAGSQTANAPNSSPTAAAGSNNSTDNQAGPIAGGVVGGVAGAALLAVLIFVLIRLYRKRQARGDRLIGSPDEEARSAPAAAAGSPPMTQRSSLAPLAAAVRRLRPDSMQTTSTATGTTGAASSERGFQKVGGRKLQSVLLTGGDGYTDPSHPSHPDSLQPPPATYGAAAARESDLSGSSFFRDSSSHYGSTAGHNSQAYDAAAPETAGMLAAATAVRNRNMQTLPSDSSMVVAGPTSNRESMTYESPATGNPFATPSQNPFAGSNSRADRALATFSTSPESESSGSLRSPTPGIDEALSYHQGPVRTPVITGGNDPPPPATRRPGHTADGLGRSNPSWDGSRHSRFSEAI